MPDTKQRVLKIEADEFFSTDARAAAAASFHNGKFSDLIIRCRDREWKLHRVTLASRCAFFDACCDGNFKVR
jgi:hypothetical protein